MERPAPSALPPSYSTPLPPSYNTPLPPSKSRQNQNGNRRQPNNRFNNNNNQHSRGHSNQHNNPLTQYQAQYQSSTQMGAAAASAAAAALSHFGYNASGSAPGAFSTTMSSSVPINNNAPPKPFQQPNTNAAPAPPSNVLDTGAPQAEWFSNYQAPTIQQRMAVTMATNVANLAGGPMGGQPYPHGGPHGRNNFQRGGHHQQHQRGGRNQRGNRNQQGGGMPRQQHPIQRQNQNQQNQNQQSKQHQQNKGPAAASTDVEMEASGFHCDACDVTFHEEAKLRTHIAAHRSCPDCEYKASPSLVAEHRKLTHKRSDQDGGAGSSSGPTTLSSMMASSASAAAGWGNSNGSNQNKPHQKSKPVAVDSELIHPLAPTLNTPEDIAAWIAQRRKAWPTESNIQKKEQERQEMIAKGQIVEDSTSNKDRNGRDRRGNNNKRDRQGKDASTSRDQKAKRPKTDDSTAAADAPPSTEPSEEDDDDDVMDPIRDAVSSKDPTVIKDAKTHDENIAQPGRSWKKCRYFIRGTCNRGDKCPYIHDTAAAAKAQKNNQSSNKKDEFRSRPSLLKMLLSGEIKDEKNKLLEAMRYIVENNFFDKQEPTGALVEEVVTES
ncbi:hypothetical protein BGW39_008089 [Mortierella sp. 14UC]|nr:hypothetical protein BGW39_008089 [Mortierella sp. 14UC]